jgi:hypothetical protein
LGNSTYRGTVTLLLALFDVSNKGAFQLAGIHKTHDPLVIQRWDEG